MSRQSVVSLLAALLLGTALLAAHVLRMRVLPDASLAADAPQNGPLAPSVVERLARIDSRLRLPPDRRAIAAVGEIRRLARGGDAVEAEVTFASGSWKIAHEGASVGMLSSLPRFSALVSLLDEWAAKQLAARDALQLAREPAVRREFQTLLNRFDDAAAFEVLAAVDARWRNRAASVGDLLAATEALAQLCMILPRDFPAADRLAARAFASLALARQLAPDRTVRAEINLAFATGYVTHARAVAAQLPFDEPIAAFARADLFSQKRVAESGDSRDADFFHGARLARSRPSEEWIAWFGGLKRKLARRTAIVGTGLELRGAAAGDFVPELYAAVLLDQLEVPDSERHEAVLTQCDALTERFDRRASGFGGPFVDRALYTDSYRSACLSALYRKLVFFIEASGQPDAALALARSLPQGASPDLAAMRDWTELVAGDDARSRDLAQLSSALANPSLALEQRETLARRALALLAVDDPRRVDVADAAAHGLDSRASARLFAGELARDVYRDPDLEERLFAATVDLDGVERTALVSQVAGFRRDWQPLWTIAGADEYRVDERMAALTELESQQPLETVRLRIAYERLLVRNAEHDPLRWQFARFLDSLGDRRAARNVLLPILAVRKTRDATSDAVAVTVAQYHLADGNAQAAWPLVESRLSDRAAASAGTRAQIVLGKLGRAEEIARTAHARDAKSPEAASELAAVLWEAKRHADAAQVIAKLPAGAADSDRCWHICRAFARTFRGKPTAEVEAAFRELVAAQLDYPLLQGTIDTFQTAAEAQTAFALGNLLNVPAAAHEIHTASYQSLKQARGEAEALAWLATVIPREELGAAAPTFYARGADELLWKLVDDPDRQGGSATWLLRAAAFVRERHPSVSHRTALVTYFNAHQETWDEQLGAALLGLSDANDLLERSRNEADLCRAAFLLATRAEAAGDVRGAMRLYQLALSTAQRTPGRELAHEAVTRITSQDVSLDALIAERTPAPTTLKAGR